MLKRIQITQEDKITKKKTILFDEMSESDLFDITYFEKDTGLKTTIYISKKNDFCEIVRYGKMRTIAHLEKDKESYIRILDSQGSVDIDVKLLSFQISDGKFVAEYQIYEFEQLVSHFVFTIAHLNPFS